MDGENQQQAPAYVYSREQVIALNPIRVEQGLEPLPLPEDEQSLVAAPIEHADLCHTVAGHVVPDGCTDESGAALSRK